MFKNKFLQIFLFVIFLIISLILLKKFNKYYSKNDFAKIIILSILAINFFFGFIIKKFSKISLIFFSYFLIIIYSVNGLLVYFDLQNLPEKQKEKIPFKKLHNAKMENLIGNQIEPYRQNIKLNENEFFFDYLKKEIKEKRKMGHITTLIK